MKRLTQTLTMAVTTCVLVIAITTSINNAASSQETGLPPGQAPSQETGLGYSEAPFELIENPQAARGITPLAAIESASASEGAITEDATVSNGDYTFSLLTFNDIGVTAVTQKESFRWRFVCRQGGVISARELNTQCNVPPEIANDLSEQLTTELENNDEL
jgi:hypothetical protein